jgi:hypothetical protein
MYLYNVQSEQYITTKNGILRGMVEKDPELLEAECSKKAGKGRKVSRDIKLV